MLKNIHLSAYLPYALAAAAAYSIPTYFFLRDAAYQHSWLLFLGNGLFLFAIFGFVLIYNRRKNENANTVSSLTAAHITTFLAVGLIFIFMLCSVLLLFRGLQTGEANKTLHDAPANMIQGNTGGMLFMLFLDATIGNLAAGSFVAIITAYAAKRDQTKQRQPRNSLDLNDN